MKLYKFRPLGSHEDFCRIIDVIDTGFHCSNFLDFNDMNEGVFYGDVGNPHTITLEEKREYKICSFSAKSALEKQLMWGHYANAGMGVAIEMEINKKDLKKENLKEVSYCEPKMCNTATPEIIKKILTRKLKEWTYEDEWRYISIDKKIKFIKIKLQAFILVDLTKTLQIIKI